ncbi:flavocytochrome c [Dolosigranulum savutiense]|uniref:Urocanate reductase n=1 Tax=Dolosigranulum savutiense TaxID=3110288 RepID=A0AB74TZ66_9LACT
MKRIKFKSGALLLASSLVLVGCQTTGDTAGDAAETSTSGVYEGTGEGRNGNIVTKVTIEDGKIKAIDVVESSETERLAEPVYEQLSEKMIARNSTEVDSVSGSTMTSEGYINSVTNALEENNVELTEATDQSEASDSQTGQLDEEYTYDVVVVGAGGAGFSAAIEAAEQGYSVTIIEKMPVTGGNTLISGGEMNAPGNWVQEKLGIDGDSTDIYYEDTMEGGNNEGNPELVRLMADSALASAEWLKDEVNVEFLDDQLFQFGGHSFQRALIPVGHTGQELIDKMEAKAAELGIDIYTETEAQSLLTTDEAVSGVVATNHDQEVTFNAAQGVILTTGGFGSNVEMRTEANEEYDDRYGTTNSPGATGDGIIMAQEVGATVDNLEHIQTYPVSNPKTGEISLLADSRFDGATLINQEGERFVEELERRDVISKAIIDQTGGYAYQVWDQTLGEETGTLEAHQRELEQLQEQDLIYVADTLEEGAEYWDIPVEQFMETIEKINAYAESGEDPDFNHRKGLASIKDAPFYFQKAAPSVHHTMGGLVINEHAEVLNESGEPIKNLYAAGELTGVIQGANRLGGNAITDIITFGRIAGKRIGHH